MDITDLDASRLAEALRTRAVSCRETMVAYLDRIERLNPAAQAIVNLRDRPPLLAEADRCDRERAVTPPDRLRWLHGIPLAVKDLSPVAGLPTSQGSPLLRHAVAASDGLMTSRLKAAGGIVIGKTNVPEFGLGSHTFNSVFGCTGNAFDPRRSAGGSSGGAAVALALRLLPVADGSDFMGSLRNPAAWNNVFGLRPSQGRVPSWPVADVWVSQLATEGPMGRSVEDLARLLDVQAGPDPRLPLSLPAHPSFADGLDSAVATGIRVGWLADLGGHLALEAGIAEVCEAALARLVRAGCIVEPSALGHSPAAVWDAWLIWRQWLVASRIAPHLQMSETARASIKPEALWEHDQAAELTGAQVLRASAERTAFYHHLLTLFERHDVLALPSAQVWPFDATLRHPSHIAGRAMDTYHRWMEVTLYATFAGLPAISIPAGFDAAGLPMGLQLIGRPQADAALLQLARCYERVASDVIEVRPATRRAAL